MKSESNQNTSQPGSARLPMRSVVNQPLSYQQNLDPEIIKSQKDQSVLILENQAQLAKDRARAEYEAQKQSITMKADHDVSLAVASIEQSKVQHLFALDQQFQQRRMEIDQRAQEQKIQIESAASQLLMSAEQQKLENAMNEKLAKLGATHHRQMNAFPQSMESPLPRTFQFPNLFVTPTKFSVNSTSNNTNQSNEQKKP
jgi:hypothetical protein